MNRKKKILLYVVWLVCIFAGIYGLVKSTYSILSEESMLFNYNVDIDTDKKIIKSVKAGTTVVALGSNLIDETKQMYLQDKSGHNKTNYMTVATGDRLILKDLSGNVVDTYCVSVMGDVNGDANVTIDDVEMLFQHYRGEIIINSDCYLKAGDVNFDIADKYIYSELITIKDNGSYQIKNLEYNAFSTNNIDITLADVAKLYQYISGTIEELDYYSSGHLIGEQVAWKSSDANIVNVDSSGNLNGVGVGSAIITAMTSTGKVYSHYVVVESSIIEPDDIILSETNVTLQYNETRQLSATVSPDDATDKNVTWESSDSDIVTVDDTGKITAVGVGDVTITVTTVNGIIVTCNVTVENADRIHFISNGNAFEEVFIADKTSVNDFKGSDGKLKGGPSPSEVILLESQGKFALIDMGLSNDGDSSNGNSGRANYTIEYLKNVGVKELEFIIVSHVHYDHLGGIYSIPDHFNIKKIYSKWYEGNDGAAASDIESSMNRFNEVQKLKTDGKIDWVHLNGDNEGKKITLGNMEITFLSTTNFTYYEDCYGEDENNNSIMNYITVNGRKIFVTGDMGPTKTTACAAHSKYSCTGKSITECVLKGNPEIRNVDVFKLPHHGYSSCDVTSSVASMLNPNNILIYNWQRKVDYYYDGIKLSNGTTLGPRLGSYTACTDAYFSTHKANNKVYYVDNTNLIYDFTDGKMDIYTIE